MKCVADLNVCASTYHRFAKCPPTYSPTTMLLRLRHKETPSQPASSASCASSTTERGSPIKMKPYFMVSHAPWLHLLLTSTVILSAAKNLREPRTDSSLRSE